MVHEGSKEFIEKVEDWPRWPLLPMINRTIKEEGFGKAALLHAADLTTLRVGNLYNMDQEKWNAAEQIHFDSVQAMVDAGWEPD